MSCCLLGYIIGHPQFIVGQDDPIYPNPKLGLRGPKCQRSRRLEQQFEQCKHTITALETS